MVTRNGDACRIISDGTATYIYQGGFRVGARYRVMFNVTEVVRGAIVVRLHGGNEHSFNSVGLKTFDMVAQSTIFGIYRNGPCDITFTNVRVFEHIVLGGGEELEAEVLFAPEAAGLAEGGIAILSNDPDNPEALVSLSGTGIANPEIAVDPDAINFGEVFVGEELTEILTISNNGNAPLDVTDIVVEGVGFTVEFGDDEPREFDWDFDRTDSNMSLLVQNAHIGEDVLAEGDYIGVFTGDGLCAGFSVVHDDFPNTQVGVAAWGAEDQMDNGFQYNERVNWRIWDTDAGYEYEAEAEYQFGNGLWVGNGINRIADLVAGRRLNAVQIAEEILPGEAMEVPVTFAPPEPGEFAGTLTIFSNDPDNDQVTVDLSGTGLANVIIVVSDDAYDFGNVMVGESAEWIFTVGNDGGGELEVAALGLEGEFFSVNPADAFVVPGGEQIEVTVTFAPAAAGPAEGSILIQSNDLETPEVTVGLAGRGVRPVIVVDTEAIDFGEVFVGDDAHVTFTISNDGDAPLDIEEIVVEGEGFTVDFGGIGPREFDWDFDRTDSNMSLLVQNAHIGEDVLAEGDYMGVFTGDGLCAGFSVVHDDFPNTQVGVAAWGAEDQMDNGFQYNERVNWRIWDTDAGAEYEAEAEYQFGNGLWVGNGINRIADLVAGRRLDAVEVAEEVAPGEAIEVTVTFSPPDVGEYRGGLTIISNDPDNGEVGIGLAGIGIPVNEPPFFVDVPDADEVDEGGSYQLVVVADDPNEDDVLVLTMNDLDGTLPEEAVFVDNEDRTGTFTWEEINFEQAGVYHVVFFVTDGEFRAEAPFTLTVININLPPVLADIGDKRVNEDDELTFTLEADDPDQNDVLTFSAENLPEGAVLDGADFSWTPTFEQADDYEVTFTVTDNGEPEEDDSETITISVINVNRAPVVRNPVADVELDEDADRTVIADLNVVFFDPDGDDLVYDVQANDELNADLNNEDILSLMPDANYHGASQVVITADDGYNDGRVAIAVGFSDNAPESGRTVRGARQIDQASHSPVRDAMAANEFTVTIISINDIPEVVQAIDDVVVEEDVGYTEVADLDDVFMDVDGDELFFALENAPQALGMGIDEDNVLYFRAADNYNLPDGVDISVTATDRLSDPVVEVFNLTITPVNDPPVWVDFPGDIEVVVGEEPIDFDLAAEDIDGDAISIYWYVTDGLPEGALVDYEDGTATVYWEPTQDDVGVHSPVFEVSDGNLEAQLTVEITVLPGLIHFPIIEPTPTNHSLLINDLTKDGETVPTGWEIGVFTPANLIAGSGKWDEEEQAGVAAWGDDPDTEDEVEGFVAGELMTIIVWDPDEDREYRTEADVQEGSLNWSVNGLTILDLEAVVSRTLNVAMRDGWSLISINVSPGEEYYSENERRGPDMILMLEQFYDEDDEVHHVVLIKDDIGRFYHPRIGFRSLRYWNLEEGYNIRTNTQLVGIWSGEPIPADAPIDIPSGWSYIPYYPTYRLDAGDPDFYVLSPIIDNVFLAKNDLGQFMAPRSNFSNMSPWRETKGYQVKLDDNVRLQYPPEPEEGALLVETEIEFEAHYAEPAITGDNMSVLITSIAGYSINPEDQIAAYSVSGNIVGTGVFDAEGRSGFPVWGDDFTTEQTEGLYNGEAFELRLWDSENSVEKVLVPIAIHDGAGLEYASDGFLLLDVGIQPEIPDHYYMAEAYPNPFNSTTHITYGLPAADHVRINVYDMGGRLIATLVNGTIKAGSHSVTWNSSEVVSGVYIVRMETGSFKSVRKVVMMK